jgi:hypothetical protein
MIFDGAQGRNRTTDTVIFSHRSARKQLRAGGTTPIPRSTHPWSQIFLNSPRISRRITNFGSAWDRWRYPKFAADEAPLEVAQADISRLEDPLKRLPCTAVIAM